MKKLVFYSVLSAVLFVITAVVGFIISNAWVLLASLLPLIIGLITVFHFRYFK